MKVSLSETDFLTVKYTSRQNFIFLSKLLSNVFFDVFAILWYLRVVKYIYFSLHVPPVILTLLMKSVLGVLGCCQFSINHFHLRNWKSNKIILILLLMLRLLIYPDCLKNIFVKQENAYLRIDIIQKQYISGFKNVSYELNLSN